MSIATTVLSLRNVAITGHALCALYWSISNDFISDYQKLITLKYNRQRARPAGSSPPIIMTDVPTVEDPAMMSIATTVLSLRNVAITGHALCALYWSISNDFISKYNRQRARPAGSSPPIIMTDVPTVEDPNDEVWQLLYCNDVHSHYCLVSEKRGHYWPCFVCVILEYLHFNYFTLRNRLPEDSKQPLPNLVYVSLCQKRSMLPGLSYTL
jgi:hypothetical protein